MSHLAYIIAYVYHASNKKFEKSQNMGIMTVMDIKLNKNTQYNEKNNVQSESENHYKITIVVYTCMRTYLYDIEI